MRLSVSNIAWDPREDDEVVTLLKRWNIDAIDVAPGKYFSDPAQASTSDITRVKNQWANKGIAIIGMQALLFGTQGLNVFGSAQSQAALLEHIKAVCRIAAGLGAEKLVFGSPKNRDRSGLNDAQAREIAVPLFSTMGDIAAEAGVTICLEPNPTCYGANFMTSSPETAEIVRLVNKPSIKMQFDTGALFINAENASTVLGDCAPLIGHIHASERDLLPLGTTDAEHAQMANAIKQFLPNHTVTLEMLATREEPHLTAIDRALHTLTRFYRDEQETTRA